MTIALALMCLFSSLVMPRGPATRDIDTPPPPAAGQQSATTLGKGEPMAATNALFQRTDGWIGADGAHSVALSDQRTLWLFSDTWIGKVRSGKRTDATMVNNTLAIQQGRGAKAKVDFVIRRGADGKPVSFIAPADGKSWYWMQAGAVVEKRLVLFLSQIEKTADPGVFGFRQIGQWIGIVANPADDPLTWRIEQRKLPCTIFSQKRILTWGAALMLDGDYLYIYGTDEDITPRGPDRHLIVARVPVKQATDVGAWKYYGAEGWTSDMKRISRISKDMASEGSASYIPALKGYVLVYSDKGMSAKICARTAPQPWGPWSEPTTVYQCPDVAWDKRIFCYAAKAHASQTAANELIVSYVANSFDFWHVASDARLYWPRFVRVPIIGEE